MPISAARLGLRSRSRRRQKVGRGEIPSLAGWSSIGPRSPYRGDSSRAGSMAQLTIQRELSSSKFGSDHPERYILENTNPHVIGKTSGSSPKTQLDLTRLAIDSITQKILSARQSIVTPLASDGKSEAWHTEPLPIVQPLSIVLGRGGKQGSLDSFGHI